VLTIVSNDIAGTVQFGQAAYEVTEGTATATVTATRSGGSASGATVQYRVAPGSPGTATGGGVDYTLATGTVTFGAGDTAKTFTVAVVNDTLVEPDETVNLELFNPSGGLVIGTQATTTLTIHDNDAPTFAFGAAVYTVAEGAAARVGVVRANGLGSAVTVGYQVQGASTATGGGQDYTLANGTLTFAAGITDRTITIPTVADALLESNETIVLKLVNPSAGTVGVPDTTTVTIVDNSVIQFSAATYTVNENAGSATITLERTGNIAASVVAMVSTVAGGTATAAADYAALTNRAVTFAAGAATAAFTVTIVDDTLVEPDETVNLQITGVAGGGVIGAQSTAVLTIVSNDVAGVVQFGQAAYQVTEGTATVTITVNRSGGSASGVTVQYRVVPGNPGTATGGGVDYTLATGTLTFAAGDTAKTFAATIVNDILAEPDETVNLELFSPSSGLVIGAQATTTLTIQDDDAPTFRFGSTTYTVVEGAAGSVAVTRANGLGGAVTVGYQVQAASTATGGGQDYTLVEGTLTFAAGITDQTITIPTVADSLLEGDETIVLKLVNPSTGTVIAPDTTTIRIIDNGNTPGVIQFSAATYTVDEGAGLATITLQRTGSVAASAAAMVSTVAGGTATAGADYAAVTGKAVTFAAGAATATFTVTIVDDTLVEPNETVNLQITSVTGGGAIGAQSSARLTIVSSDVAGTVQFAQAAYDVTEGAATATITVNRSGGSASGVTVQYRVVPGTPGTATGGGVDYTLATGTVTFGAGDIARTFTVAIVNDTIIEPDETVNLELVNPSSGLVIGPQATATLTIHDNDSPTFRFAGATYTVAEGGTANVTVMRANGVGSAVTVAYQVQAASSATGGGQDYTLTSGTVSFAAGVTTQAIAIPTTASPGFEGNETIVLKLVNPSAGTLIAPDTTTITISDVNAPGTIQFSAPAYSVVESEGPAVVRVTRAGTNLASGVTVQLTTTGGTATAGIDYTSSTQVLTFAAGEAFKDVAIPILGDNLSEGNETVVLTLSNPTSGATLGTSQTSVLTILDDEQSVQFSAPAYTVTEATAPVTVTVVRIGPAFGTVTVDYTTATGSAALGTDYAAVTGTLTFAPGITSKTFTVPILSDTLFEPTETVTVRLSNPTGGASLGPQATATISIVDNDPAGLLRFSAVAYAVSEAAGVATITVQRTQGTASAVTVDYATVSGGTAAVGVDYTATSGTLTFNANDTSKTFTVPVLDDRVDGADKTVNLVLSNPTGGATLGTPSTAVLTISDDDTPGTIQFSTTAYSVIENVGPAIVRVTRTGTNLASGVTVQFTTTNGTATAGTDYVDATRALTFAAGEAFKDVPIATIGDSLAEGNETVALTLSDPSAGALLGANKTAVLTILDDEQSMQFSAPVYVVTEAATPVTITVTRTGPPLGTVTVDYATAAGSATAGLDYLDASGTLTFPPGVATRTFTVPMPSDTMFEPTESISLLLTNPTGSALLGPQSTAAITIVDNDPPGAIRFSAATYAVSEAAGAVITVVRTGTASAVTVEYATVGGGTATAGADFLTTTGTLTFNAGDASKTFVVPILNDSVDEPNETVNLVLSNPTGGATLGTPSAALLTITDDDVPGPITFSAASYTLSETAGLALITVRRTGAASGVTVAFTTADGSATAPDDYTAVAQTLSFGAGETSKLVAVPIVDDLLREGNETIRLILSNPTGGATVGPIREAVLTLTDNETGPTVQFSAAAYTVAENVAGGVFNVTITRTGSTASGQTVWLSASAGSATNGTDFVAISNQLVTFTGTQASVTVPVTIVDNPGIVGSRIVDLRLSSPGGGLSLGVPRAAQLTILEDDATVQFASAIYTVTEGDAVALTVTRTGGTIGTASVGYATSAGTATSGADYTNTTGTLVFGPGVTSQTITVATLNDVLVEGPETFTVVLSNPNPAVSTSLGAPSTATVTITDNDAFGSLRFASAAYSVTEGGAAALTVTRTGGAAGTVTVQYATSNGGGGGSPALGGAATATDIDYTTTSGTLTFLNGVVSQAIIVPTKADTLLEGPETFTVTLSSVGGGATLGTPAAAVVTIVDDETPRLQFATATYTVAEPAGSVTLTVQRVGPTTVACTVQYALAGGTATGGGVDFVGTGGVLTFGVGVASRTIVVPITNDTVHESPETFTATLSSPTGGAILGTPSIATVTITDNDPAGTVGFSQASYAVVEGSTATITVTRTGTSGPVTVDFATSNGTASASSDYPGTSGTLTFLAGELTKTFTVATATDGSIEGSESIVLTLSNPTNGLTLGPQSGATLWIVDEAQSVQFGSASYSVIEGGTVLVTVTRGGVPTGTVTVGFQIGGGSTAFAGVDFTLTPAAGTLTFAPGVAALTIAVATVNDQALEGPESIVLQLANPAGATLGTPSSTRVTVIDNERPDLVIGSVAGPAQAATGVPMTVVTTVRNQTGGAAPATTLAVFISSSSNVPGAGTRIGLVTIPALAGGASYTATASVGVPAGLAPGNYFLSVLADAAGVAIEESEANNGLTAPAQVDVVAFQ
jgi:azurin